jgi:MOSC domain-containing protein YiiM
MGFRHAVKHMLQSGFTGVYLKVVQQGSVQNEVNITLLPGPREVSIADINGRRLKGRQRDLFP